MNITDKYVLHALKWLKSFMDNSLVEENYLRNF